MDALFTNRGLYGHVNGKNLNVSEAECCLFLDELKKLMIRFDIVKIDICRFNENEEISN